MFKLYNLTLYYAIFLCFVSACLIAFEVMFGSYILASWKYWPIVFNILLMAAYLSFTLKFAQKWSSAYRIFKLKNSESVVYETKLSNTSINWARFFSATELVFNCLAIYFFLDVYYLPIMVLLLVIMAIDLVLWYFISGQISLLVLPSAVVFCEREGNIIPTSHLKSLEMSFNRLFFETTAGRYSMDAKSIPDKEKSAFLNALKSQAPDSTYISDGVKNEFK